MQPSLEARTERSLGLSHPVGILGEMAEDHLWTAAELEQLTPNERDRVVKAGMVTDLSKLPPDLVDRVRARGRRLLEQRGIAVPDEA
jgi:hypothetical protein